MTTLSIEAPLADVPLMEWWGIVDYTDALERMARAHAARVAVGISENDHFFYLEHPKVITYGRSTPPGDLHLRTDSNSAKIPRIEVPRGGLATYHAPGQLVGYIVMDLTQRADGARPDIHAYLRAIELGLIAFLKAEFDLDAGLREGFTGVWTSGRGILPLNESAQEPDSPQKLSRPDSRAGSPCHRKLASIGVSARKWVTSHGFALNIHPDMTGFHTIVPCGIRDAEMTSVKLELERAGRPFTEKPMQTLAELVHAHLTHALQAEGWLL